MLKYCHQAHSLGQSQMVFWLDASLIHGVSLGLEPMHLSIKRSINE